MDDITLKHGSKKSDFEVSHIEHGEAKHEEPGEHVKVKFSNFVELMASHNVEGVMKKHEDAEIILSTNLLTDLANAHEESQPESSRKLPIIFIVGIIVGIVLTYLLIRF